MLIPFPVALKKYSHKIKLSLLFQWDAVHEDWGDTKSGEEMATGARDSLVILQLQAERREQSAGLSCKALEPHRPVTSTESFHVLRFHNFLNTLAYG